MAYYELTKTVSYNKVTGQIVVKFLYERTPINALFEKNLVKITFGHIE